jgi:hypothetical protein
MARAPSTCRLAPFALRLAAPPPSFRAPSAPPPSGRPLLSRPPAAALPVPLPLLSTFPLPLNLSSLCLSFSTSLFLVPPPFLFGLVLDLVTLTLGVRGQEPNLTREAGGTGRGAGSGIRCVIRGRIRTWVASCRWQPAAMMETLRSRFARSLRRCGYGLTRSARPSSPAWKRNRRRS